MTLKTNCDHKCHTVGLNTWVESCPVCGCPNVNFSSPEFPDLLTELISESKDMPRDPEAHYIGYACQKCRVKRFIKVPKKLRAVDIHVWMERVKELVALDHDIASPSCQPPYYVDFAIPLNENDELGKFQKGNQE